MNIDTFEKTAMPIIKGGIGLLSGAGISRIIDGVVANNVAQTSMFGRISIIVAKTTVSAAVSNAVDKNTNESIDAVFAAIKKFSTPSSKTA